MNLMINNCLWICWVTPHKWQFSKTIIPRGVAYINDKPAFYWCLIWRIQFMWITKNGNRGNKPFFYSLKKWRYSDESRNL